MALTDSERAVLEGYKVSSGGASGFGLYTVSIAGRMPVLEPTVFLSDDQQINIGDLDPWGIPFTDPRDVNHP